MPSGGARPNSGPKKGTKYGPKRETLTKAEHRQLLAQAILKHQDRMLRSQVAAAIGIGHLFTRDKGGKFTRIENPALADKLLTEGTEGQDYYIFMKDPSTAAWTDLMNRALDKPTEAINHEHSGTVTVRWKG